MHSSRTAEEWLAEAANKVGMEPAALAKLILIQGLAAIERGDYQIRPVMRNGIVIPGSLTEFQEDSFLSTMLADPQ